MTVPTTNIGLHANLETELCLTGSVDMKLSEIETFLGQTTNISLKGAGGKTRPANTFTGGTTVADGAKALMTATCYYGTVTIPGLGSSALTTGSYQVYTPAYTSNTSVTYTATFSIGTPASISQTVTWYTACFPAGSLVTMADGSKQKIEDVKNCDEVLSRDLETGKNITGQVKKISSGYSENICALLFESGKVLRTTTNHPIRTTEGWKAVDAHLSLQESPDLSITTLEVGDLVVTETGADCLSSIQFQESEQTYNLSAVNPCHTFFVEGVLVHNKECVPAGTPIKMADGSELPIEDVSEGSEVFAYDENSMEPITSIVTRNVLTNNQRIGVLKTKAGFLICSDEHRLHSKNKNAWVMVTELDTGDITFWTKDDEITETEVISYDPIGILDEVYQLCLETGHIYVAGGVPTHNKCCFPAGSKVLMADKTWKTIEKVEAGDSVIGIDGLPNKVYAMDYPLLGNRTYLKFEDNSLYTSASHCLWTKTEDGEWFVTRDKKALAVEAMYGVGADLLKEPIDNTRLDEIEYAHVDGFKKLKTEVVEDADPFIQLYQVLCDRSRTYIVNGYVVGSVPDDRTFDYSAIKWDEVRKTL